jgi:hypothetical protein
MKNIFFPYLQWILKSSSSKPEIPKNVGFLSNRWLSMASKPIAQIVNSTSNRWNNCQFSFDDETNSKIYRTLIPKFARKINYIKKSPKEDEEMNENIEFYSNLMELSRKEIEEYQKTLEELNLTPK